MQPEQRVYQVWDRVDYIAHKSVRYRNGDNSTAVVDVAGRQGTINQECRLHVLSYRGGYPRHRDHSDTSHEARRVGGFSHRDGFVLLKPEKHGASGDHGFLYRRPLAKYSAYELMYEGSV